MLYGVEDAFFCPLHIYIRLAWRYCILLWVQKASLIFNRTNSEKRDSQHEVTFEYSVWIHFEWNLSQRTHAGQALASNQNALDNDLHKKSYKYLFICFTYMHSKSQPEKNEKKSTLTFLVFTFYCHAKRMHKSTIFSVLHFVVFVFFYWYWFWLLFFGTFSRPFRVCLDSLHKENLNDLSNYFKRKGKWATERIVEFSLFEIFAVSPVFPSAMRKGKLYWCYTFKKVHFHIFWRDESKICIPVIYFNWYIVITYHTSLLVLGLYYLCNLALVHTAYC